MAKLTEMQVRKAQPREKAYRLHDEHGLVLAVAPSGHKAWRFRYTRPQNGRENMITIGPYPLLSLKEARERRDELRRMLVDGIDPGKERKARKRAARLSDANRFRYVAEDFLRNGPITRRSEAHQNRVRMRLNKHVLPIIGDLPVDEIMPRDVLEMAHKILDYGYVETAHKCVQYVGQVIRYAIAQGRATIDPTVSLRGQLPTQKSRHMAAITDPAKLGGILRLLWSYQGSIEVVIALRLLPYVFVRPSELVSMRWADIDFELHAWRYTVSKTGTEHMVPLSRQALALIEQMRPHSAHRPAGWVFPGARDHKRHLAPLALNAAYKRLGIDTTNEITPHGWRATARTLLQERLGYPPEVIEQQLAHTVPDALGRAYNRTRFLEVREEMMQRWADYLDDHREQKIDRNQEKSKNVAI